MLEVIRHVNIGHELIRPMTERVTGQRAISAYFDGNPDKDALGRAAWELMQGDRDGCSYTAVGGRWIESSLAPPATAGALTEPRPLPPLETRVSELHAQVVFLVALLEGVSSRLARVETKLLEPSGAPSRRGSGGAPPGGSPPALAPAAEAVRRGPADSVEAPVSSARAPETPREDGDLDEPRAPSPLAPDAVPSASADPVEEPARPPPDPERSELRLPPIAELARCMSLLIGGEVTVKGGEPLSVNRTTRDCYAASLLDEADRCVGLIVMDLAAAVFLGGTLMMLPRGELDAQLAAASPGEDSIAAAAEICNALAAAVSAQSRAVRAGNLEKLDFRRTSWVTDPAERRDLEDSFGGRTSVLARRIAPPVG